jgi:hypothetical protein
MSQMCSLEETWAWITGSSMQQYSMSNPHPCQHNTCALVPLLALPLLPSLLLPVCIRAANVC